MTVRRSPHPKLSIPQKLVLILLGLVLSLVLLEGGLRLGGFVLLAMQEYENSQAIQRKGAYRILCLGESTTQGQYPRFLEDALNARNIGVRFSVIDKGLAGTTTPVIVSRVESFLTQYHPDMVVAMMGINDQGKHGPPEATAPSKGVRFIRSFRIYKLARLLWLHLLVKAEEWGFCKAPQVWKDSDAMSMSLRRGQSKKVADASIPEESSLKKAIEVDPQNGHAYVDLGWFYQVHDKAAQAEDAFKKALEIDPGNDRARINLGRLYLEHGKLSQAEDAFRKVIELDPGNDLARVELGWLYQDQDKLSQAEEFFKKAVEVNPENDNTRVEIGRFYRSFGQLLKAKSAFEKAVEINPKNDYAYMELGKLYLAQSAFSEAEDAFKRALEIDPGNDRASIDLGWLFQAQGQFAQAEAVLEKAVQRDPKNDRLLRALSCFYKVTNRPDLAGAYARKADRLREQDYSVSAYSYRQLKEMLDKHKVKFVCVQYPMRDVEPLTKAFEREEGIIFVDNERVFKEALKRDGYKEYFTDMFAGDFGHCTPRGNELLAQNIAWVILKEVFDR